VLSSTRITSKGRMGRAAATQGGGTKFGARAMVLRLCAWSRTEGDGAHMWGARASAVQCTHLPDEVGRALLAVLGRSPELLGDHCEPEPCIFRSLDQPDGEQARSSSHGQERLADPHWRLEQHSCPAPAHRWRASATFAPCFSPAVSFDLGTAHAAPLTDRTRPRMHPGRRLSALRHENNLFSFDNPSFPLTCTPGLHPSAWVRFGPPESVWPEGGRKPARKGPNRPEFPVCF
jgi:hypothetical protein